MFKTIKLKLQERNLRKEKDCLNQKHTEKEQELSKYERLLEDLTNNYIPLRDKCVDLIHRTGLDHYELIQTLNVSILDNNKIEFKVYDLKEYYWDACKITEYGNLLFDETIQLNSLDEFRDVEWPIPYDPYNSEADYIISLITKLEGINTYILKVKRLKEKLEELENKINRKEKQI